MMVLYLLLLVNISTLYIAFLSVYNIVLLLVRAGDCITMSEQNSPTSSDGRKSEIIGLNRNIEDGDDGVSDRDKEGELVKLDYDIETSQGERALKVFIYTKSVRLIAYVLMWVPGR